MNLNNYSFCRLISIAKLNGKKNLKRLLISILTIIFSLVLYLCLPFLINFDIEKKAKIETLFSDTIRYQVSIKGSIKYKLNPLPTLEISEIHFLKKMKIAL